jgi:YbbR domain-containing protein
MRLNARTFARPAWSQSLLKTGWTYKPMHGAKHWITHNWFLKLLSLAFAMTLWVAVASETSSEIGIEVPLEYRNVPADLEITGDPANTVDIRLRGPANAVKDITSKEVTATVDLANMTPGEKTIMLTAQNVSTPFGMEVIRLNPSEVRLSLEQTMSKTVLVVPTTQGQPEVGFELGRILVNPGRVRVQGPESRLRSVDSISTVPIVVDGKRAPLQQTVALDVRDSQLRIQGQSRVDVRVDIRKASR